MPITRLHLEALNRSFADADAKKGQTRGFGAGGNFINHNGFQGFNNAGLKKSPSLTSIPSTNESLIYGVWGERELPPAEPTEYSPKKNLTMDDGYSTDSLEMLPFDPQISTPQDQSWCSEISTPTKPESRFEHIDMMDASYSATASAGHGKGFVEFRPFAPADFRDPVTPRPEPVVRAPLSNMSSGTNGRSGTRFAAISHGASSAANFMASETKQTMTNEAQEPMATRQQHFHQQAPQPLPSNPPVMAGGAGAHGGRLPMAGVMPHMQVETRAPGRCIKAYGTMAKASRPGVPQTTVVLQGLPYAYNRDLVLELLDQFSLMQVVDFIYMPSKFETGTSFGYAFINFLSEAHVAECKWRLDGFSAFKTPSNGKVCEVSLAEVHGLAQNIQRYRNSPVMHKNVPDELKPIILSAGHRMPFPPPTKNIKAPRLRKD